MQILPSPVDILNQKELVNIRNVNYVEYARYAGFVVKSNLLLALKDMTFANGFMLPSLGLSSAVETKPMKKLANTDNI